MKKIVLKEESFRKLRENLEGEISYGTVNRAHERANDMFWSVKTSFEDFYHALEDAIFKTKYDSRDGEETSNPYLEKIKQLSEPIYDILVKKGNQEEKFFDATTGSVDHTKFYNGEDADENDIDDMDLRYLQNKYPKN